MRVCELDARIAEEPTEKQIVQLLRMPDAGLVDYIENKRQETASCLL